MLGLALVGTILGAPLRHDEQFFASMGILYRSGDLYRDLGFNHLPNLPILLDGVLQLFGVERPVLAFRWVIVAGWLATATLTGAIAWRLTGSIAITALCLVLLITNPLLVGQAGTLVSNNFLPVPFALAGLLVVLAEAERRAVRPWAMALAGFLLAIAIGMKANYVLLIPPFAIAMLFAPIAPNFRDRLMRVILPMLAGAIIGGAPSIMAFAGDPPGFVDHVFGYHRGPHLAWALASPEPLVISLRDRMVLARSLWGDGGTLLLAAAIVAAAAQLALRGWRADWATWLVAGLVVTGIAVAFLPRPSFPQYFTPPLPFAIVLLALLARAQTFHERRAFAPLLVAVGTLALVLDAPKLITGLPVLTHPGKWTGNRVHAIALQVRDAARGGRVATLSPLYALDGGARIYPQLASGPFVYRVADRFTTAQRPHWRTLSPTTLAAGLDADPPGAILVGGEGDLDMAFRAYAGVHHYRRLPLAGGDTRYGELELYVPTSGSISLPAPTRAATSSLPLPLKR